MVGDGPGASDMIRYGISLMRVARLHPECANVHMIDPGVESPLAEDVLSSPRWKSLSEQIHRAGNLLLLSIPSRVPGVERLLTQLDGTLLVGDAASPAKPVRILGEVRTSATMRTPSIPVRSLAGGKRKPKRGMLVVVLSVAALLLASLLIPGVRNRVAGFLSGTTPLTAADSALSGSGDMSSLPATASRLSSDAAWSTELLFTNSESDALSRSREFAGMMPATTYSATAGSSDSATWYRVTGGAFPDSISAENFLVVLRGRGVIGPTAGTVIHAPYALVVDSTREASMSQLRVLAYNGRGLPAYALRDSTGWWRIYIGAFSEGPAAVRQQRFLDSLDIQSTLSVRVGSTS